VNLIECRDEKLMSILLRIASQFGGSTPRSGKETDGTVRSGVVRVDLNKEFIHFATGTVFNFTWLTAMLLPQEVITEEGIVNKTLKDSVKEARLSEV